ncbi:MAG: Ldh family oxidoreductase, partial [Actinobacteria bacterium]|nr:Ldh family oxidoreductase [Actinomycetota bacterium]
RPGSHEELRFRAAELTTMTTDVLRAMGTPPATAELVAESLVLSNLVGHDSHGIVRLVQYWDLVKKGQIRPGGAARVVNERGAVATVDGGWGFGQPAAQMATELARGLASLHGASVVAIRSCNHIGRLGEYVATLARAGQMGMAFCNSGPAVAPFGGAGRVLGTNPFAWSCPLRDEVAVLDFATSKVAEGKLKIALAEGHKAPARSIVDANGLLSDDPAAFYAGGALTTFGEHKGSGMSMLIELTAGLMSAMGTSCDPAYLGGNGTVVLSVNIAAFVDLEWYLERAEVFSREARRIGAGPGGVDVLFPGEVESRTLEDRRNEGVLVPAGIRRQVTAVADELDVGIGLFALR